ncbi:transcriptional regulator swi6, partial [Rhizopus azygosporus]
VPFEKGKALAEKYHVLDIMMPLLSFDPSNVSSTEQIPTKEQALTEQLSHSPPSSPTDYHSSIEKHRHKRPKLNSPTSPREGPLYEQQRNMLMNIFLTEDFEKSAEDLNALLLLDNFDVDLVIDEQGHTALHWAAALGKIPVVQFLIEKGASICRANYDGETPLMRAVMITCCYESKCFYELVEIMKDSVGVTDSRGRTVLHHIALTAGVPGYADAAIYYMKILLKLIPKKSQIRYVLEVKDRVFSESALAIAMRLECQEIVDLLVKHGALDPIIPRKDPDTLMEHSPTEYRSSAKGRDLVHSVQLMVDKLEEEYQDQLRRKDKEAFRREQELKLVKYELKEALKRLELPTTVQLAEARKRIRELEDEVFRFENKKIESTDGTDNNGSANDVTSKDKLIKSLQHQLDTSLQTIEQLKQELELVKEREMEYKRLIATCCNTPLEKLDILIKPLTLAIENDPPDLDMTRVIGFMEKLQRRGSVNSNSGTPHDLSSTPTF